MIKQLLCIAAVGAILCTGCDSSGATAEDKEALNKIKTEGLNQKLEPGQRPGFRTDGYPHETTAP